MVSPKNSSDNVYGAYPIQSLFFARNGALLAFCLCLVTEIEEPASLGVTLIKSGNLLTLLRLSLTRTNHFFIRKQTTRY